MTEQEKEKYLAEMTEDDFQKLLEVNKPVRSLFDSRLNKGTATSTQTWIEKQLPELKKKWEAETGTDARERQIEQKLEAIKLAADRGIDVELAFRLLGLDSDATDESRLDAAEEIKKAGRTEFLKANGRTPRVTLPQTANIIDRLAALPVEQQARLSDSTIALAEKEMMAQGKPRPWKTFTEKLFGGRE